MVGVEGDEHLAFEAQIERLSFAHHRVGFVHERDHLQHAARIQMFGGVLEAQKTQRAHRVAGVDRLADAVGAPQRRAAVTQFVAIFDVVVHQRIVVKYFDRHGGIDRVLRRRAFAGGDAHHHLRAQPLAAPRRSVRP